MENLNEYVDGFVKNLHPDGLGCIFLGGSFARGSQTKLSDIDYTAVILKDVNHPRFYFELIKLDDVIRLLSIYFFKINEVMPENPGDDEYLWLKKMLPETRYISGDKKIYEKIKSYYLNLEYTREPKHNTIHKSYGKLLEIIARIKKWNKKGNFVEMVYYGQKLAEHVRRLIVEINGPISVNSENVYLDAHFELPKVPKDFKNLYLEVNRYLDRNIKPDDYEKACIELVKNTTEILKENSNLIDSWTKDLINNRSIDEYLNMREFS